MKDEPQVGQPEVAAVNAAPNYFAVLERIHNYLRPSTYLEIGVAGGKSLALAQPGTHAIGVDPQPLRWVEPIRCWVKHFTLTSDEFFEQHDLAEELGARRLELAFIDGMHLFEYALRDFMNVERYCDGDTVVLLHDCIPIDAQISNRERKGIVWTGDVWKLAVCLNEYRPDLAVSIIDARPSGLGVVTGLNASSKVLPDRHEEILDKYLDLDYEWIAGRRDKLDVLDFDWELIRSLLPRPKSPESVP